MINKLRYICYFFLIPHYLIYRFTSKETKKAINEDILVMNKRLNIKKGLLYYLAFKKPYRNLFYYRIGGIIPKILKRIVREYPGFVISYHSKIQGGAYVLSHPFSSIINAESIGKNFYICQLTTIGNKYQGRNDLIPVIGDNVSLGANVTIIGKVKIGNNVVIGAGSVVVKDIPSNCIVIGNPAKVIKKTK